MPLTQATFGLTTQRPRKSALDADGLLLPLGGGDGPTQAEKHRGEDETFHGGFGPCIVELLAVHRLVVVGSSSHSASARNACAVLM